MNSYLYGNYRTRKFTDIYPDVDSFKEDYNNIGISTTISVTSITTLYYLLYARYGNNPIASSDETRFKYDLFGIVFCNGPAWESKLAIQNNIRNLTQEQIIAGSTNINNHSYNPSTAPTTSTVNELPTVDSQDTSKYRKSLVTAYNDQFDAIKDDVTTAFLNKFRRLFLMFASPEEPLWYVEGDEENV